jgi:hypothetical protein
VDLGGEGGKGVSVQQVGVCYGYQHSVIGITY